MQSIFVLLTPENKLLCKDLIKLQSMCWMCVQDSIPDSCAWPDACVMSTERGILGQKATTSFQEEPSPTPKRCLYIPPPDVKVGCGAKPGEKCRENGWFKTGWFTKLKTSSDCKKKKKKETQVADLLVSKTKKAKRFLVWNLNNIQFSHILLSKGRKRRKIRMWKWCDKKQRVTKS